jgi:hypothetical protein
MTRPADTFVASQALLAAALGGLLCVASAGCSSNSSDSSAPVTNADSPIPDTECPSGYYTDPTDTSVTAVNDETEDVFKSACDAKNGIFEVQPQCGGANACRGMSYDSKTQTLSEHTCRATNTCAGYSCVICN